MKCFRTEARNSFTVWWSHAEPAYRSPLLLKISENWIVGTLSDPRIWGGNVPVVWWVSKCSMADLTFCRFSSVAYTSFSKIFVPEVNKGQQNLTISSIVFAVDNESSERLERAFEMTGMTRDPGMVLNLKILSLGDKKRRVRLKYLANVCQKRWRHEDVWNGKAWAYNLTTVVLWHWLSAGSNCGYVIQCVIKWPGDAFLFAL